MCTLCIHVYIHTHIYIGPVAIYIHYKTYIYEKYSMRGGVRWQIQHKAKPSAVFDMKFNTKYRILLYIMSKLAVSWLIYHYFRVGRTISSISNVLLITMLCFLYSTFAILWHILYWFYLSHPFAKLNKSIHGIFCIPRGNYIVP